MSSTKVNLSVGVLLAVVLVAAYLPALGSGFLAWDDREVLEEIPADPGTTLTRRIYKTWLPVYTASLWLDREVWGTDDALPYRVVNLLLHFVNALLVMRIARRIGLSRVFAWGAGFVFALHPLATESVAWIAERKGLLAFTFGALSILTCLKAVKAEGAKRVRGHVAGSIFLLLALLAKGSALVVPPILLVYALVGMNNRPARPRMARELWPYFSIALFMAVAHYWIAREEGPALAGGETVGRAVAALPVLARYLRLLFLPFWGQSLVPDVQPVSGIGDLDLPVTLPVLALVAVGLWFAYRKDRCVFFGLVIAILALAPYNNLFPKTTVLFAERYLYVSILGAALLVAALASRAGRAAPAVLGTVVLLLGAFTLARAGVWSDEVEVFRDADRKAAGSWLAPMKLADALSARAVEAGRAPEETSGLWREAAAAYGHAAESARGPAQAVRSRVGESVALTFTGDPEAALHALSTVPDLLPLLSREESASLEPDYHVNRGLALYYAGRPADAADAYREAARADPRDARPLIELTKTLLGLGDTAGALQAGARAVDLDPGGEEACRYYAGARLAAGDTKGASDTLQGYLAEYPGAVGPRCLLGQVSLRSFRPREAMGHFRIALESDPENQVARTGMSSGEYMLALDAKIKGDLDGARGRAHAALEWRPEAPGPRVFLATITTDRAERERLLREAVERGGGGRPRQLLAGIYLRDAAALDRAGKSAAAAVFARDALKLKPPRLTGESRLVIEGLVRDIAKVAGTSAAGTTPLLCGIARMLGGDLRDAEARFTEAAESAVDAGGAEGSLRLALLLRGIVRMERGDLEGAGTEFEFLAGLDKEALWPWPAVFRAESLLRLASREKRVAAEEERPPVVSKLFNAAMRWAERAAKTGPELMYAVLKPGEVALASERYAEALSVFLRVRDAHPRRVEPRMDLADLYRLQYLIHGGKHYLSEAETELNVALRIDPDNARALAARGEVRVQLNRQSGVSDLRRAVELDPDLVEARESLTRIFLREAKGRLERGGADSAEQASLFAQRAIALNTGDIEPYLLLVEIARARKDFETAWKHLQQVIRREPESGRVRDARATYHRDLGYAYLLAGGERGRERGLAEFRKAVEAEAPGVDLSRERVQLGLDEPPPVEGPDALGPEASEILGERTEEARRRFDEAARLFEAGELEAAEAEARASLTARSSAEGRYLLGLILEKSRRAEEAEKAFEAAVKEKPGLAEAWLNLGTLRYYRGDIEGAVGAYETYLKAAGDTGPGRIKGMVEARIREMRDKLDADK